MEAKVQRLFFLVENSKISFKLREWTSKEWEREKNSTLHILFIQLCEFNSAKIVAFTHAIKYFRWFCSTAEQNAVNETVRHTNDWKWIKMHRIYQNFWTYLCWYLTENDALQVELNVAKEREKMARDVKNKDDDGTENHIMYRRDKRTSSQMKWKMHDCMRMINAHIDTTSETDSHTQPRTPTSPNGISNELTRAGIYLFINIWLSQPHYHI